MEKLIDNQALCPTCYFYDGVVGQEIKKGVYECACACGDTWTIPICPVCGNTNEVSILPPYDENDDQYTMYHCKCNYCWADFQPARMVK